MSQLPEIQINPEIHPRHGLHLPALDLWLDAPRAKSFSFISHAHSDHVARHQRILCSPVTAHLLQRRYRIARDRLTIQHFHEPITWNDHCITLLPAGHIPGSAMLHVRSLCSQASLLYTGDYKLRPSRAAEPASWLQADTLIMESTFGLPHYVLPPAADIEKSILRFIHNAIADHATPVLLGYSLGKAQEIAAILAAHHLPFVSSKTVCEMTQACREAGCTLPEPQLWEGKIPLGTTLIAPPQILKQPEFFSIPHRRSCMMTGWALNASAKFRYGTDDAIPLSDHADFPDLLETAALVQPKKIITIHGSTRELASTLRQRGYNAWSHFGNDQLDLPL